MAATTSITITAPAPLAQLTQASGVVILKDPTGQVRGTCTADGGRRPPVGMVPFTDEESAELSEQRTGRPLADIIKDLNARYGA